MHNTKAAVADVGSIGNGKSEPKPSARKDYTLLSALARTKQKGDIHLHCIDPYSKAMIWRKLNPRAWDYMVFLAQKEAACNKKVSVRLLIEEARREESLHVKLDNTCSPALARMLIREYPSLRKAISTRVSKLERQASQRRNKVS